MSTTSTQDGCMYVFSPYHEVYDISEGLLRHGNLLSVLAFFHRHLRVVQRRGRVAVRGGVGRVRGEHMAQEGRNLSTFPRTELS